MSKVSARLKALGDRAVAGQAFNKLGSIDDRVGLSRPQMLRQQARLASLENDPAMKPVLGLRLTVHSSARQLATFEGRYLSFSPDGKAVLTYTNDGLHLYDLTGKALATLKGDYQSFSPDGKTVVTEINDGSRLYDLTGKALATFQGDYQSFSPDGKTVVTATDASSYLYDLTGR